MCFEYSSHCAHAPKSLLPCAVQSAQAHCSAKIRTSVSSDRVCINTSRLSRLSSPSSVAVSPSATRLAETISLSPNEESSSWLAPAGVTSATKTGMTCCRRSSRQNTVLFGRGGEMNVRRLWYMLSLLEGWLAVRTSFVHVHALGQCLDNTELGRPDGALLPVIGTP
jgi:hypothetical protein